MSHDCTRAIIDLDAVSSNFDAVCRKAKVPVMAVIKADAYGHGAVPIARLLENRCAFFGVSSMSEALELRDAGIARPILILGYTPPQAFPDAVRLGIRPAIFRREDGEVLSRAAVEAGVSAAFHFAVDTGMSRIGFQVTEADAQNGSRLSAGSLRYAIAHSGGTGDGIRFPSKCFQSFEIAVYLSVAVKRIVVVRTEVMESSLVFKNVVYGDQHGMGDCKRGSIFATSSRNSLVLCKEIRTLYGFCRLCTLRQNRFECLISFRRFTMFSSSCALVVTGTDTSP